MAAITIKALYEGKKSYWSQQLPPTNLMGAKDYLTAYYLFSPTTTNRIPHNDQNSFCAIQIPKDAIISAKPVGIAVDFENKSPGGIFSKLIIHDIELDGNQSCFIVKMQKQGNTYNFNSFETITIARLNDAGFLSGKVAAQGVGTQDNYINCSVSRPPCN